MNKAQTNKIIGERTDKDEAQKAPIPCSIENIACREQEYILPAQTVLGNPPVDKEGKG